MTEPVGWTLVDTHTPVDPLGRYTTRDDALKALHSWEVYAAGRTHSTGRYLVCALVPDGDVT